MKISRWRRALHQKTLWFSLLVILAFGLVAVLAPWLAPHDPYRTEIGQGNLPPMWVDDLSPAGDAEHPLGTDRWGRDILSRQIYGARTAFFLALIAVPLAAFIGTLVGLVAGYTGGRLDAALVNFTDAVQSLPGIMFAVIIVLIFRSRFPPTWIYGLITLVIAFVAVAWVSLARLVRINVLVLRSKLFMEAAVSIGASSWRILTRHLLPNVSHVTMVWIINTIPVIILLEAILGYIGVGLTSAVEGSEFTVVSWGGLFFSGRAALSRNPLMLVVPSVCILLISMSFLLLGDYLSESTRPGESIHGGEKALPLEAADAVSASVVGHPQGEQSAATAEGVKAAAIDAEMESAFAWLASLSIRQGADSAQMDAGQERSVASPEWVVATRAFAQNESRFPEAVHPEPGIHSESTEAAGASVPGEPTPAALAPDVETSLASGAEEILLEARSELAWGNPQASLQKYQELIQSERLLPQVVKDLQDALDRTPADLSLWMLLGDVQMRLGLMQAALDAYTRAEKLVRPTLAGVQG